jgi:hypothetical protein
MSSGPSHRVIGAIPHLQDLTLWHICSGIPQNLLSTGLYMQQLQLRRLSLGIIGLRIRAQNRFGLALLSHSHVSAPELNYIRMEMPISCRWLGISWIL